MAMKSLLNVVLIVGVGYISYQWGSSKVQQTNREESSADTTSKISLYYFDARWTTETIRLLLKYGGLNFDDIRVKEEWPELKPTAPYGHLPFIEENGKRAAQSIAIARYIAKKVKLNGANDWEDLEIDGVVDTLNDVKEKLARIFEEGADEAALKEKHLKDTLPYYFEKLDKRAKENNGYLVGKKLTWADFYFYVVNEVYVGILGEDIIKKYPNLEKVKGNVFNIPVIKEWLKVRPKTNF